MVLLQSLPALAIATGLVIRVATGQNITASTCISPSGFSACYQQASNFYEQCSLNAGTDLDNQLACGCVLNQAEIDCAFENCWNEVYGCQVQGVIVEFISYCPGSGDMPYFPAPDNAPGACSCNIGAVLEGISQSLEYSLPCVNGAADLTKVDACICCEQAGVYASLYSICPSVSPAYLGFAGLDDLLSISDPPFNQCQSYFSQYNCVSDLGYASISAHSYLTSLPATTGTASYSDTSGSLTAPPNGATFVYTWNSLARTITAASAAHAKGSSSVQISSQTGAVQTATTHASSSSGTQTSGTHSSTSTGSASAVASSSSSSSQHLIAFRPSVLVAGAVAFVLGV